MLQREWRLPFRKLVLAMPLTAASSRWPRTPSPTCLDGVLPARRAAVPHRPGPLVVRRHEPARAAGHPPLAQPGVGDERRPRAAGGAGPRRGAEGRATATSCGGSSSCRTSRSGSPTVVDRLVAAGCCRAAAGSDSIPAHQLSLYALGVAFAAYGAPTLPPEGNGLIAVYVCAITLGIRRPDIAPTFEERADDIIEVVKLGDLRRVRRAADLRRPVRRRLGRGGDRGLHAARRPPRRDLRRAGRDARRRAHPAFMAWFGPKGVATMTFSLLVLSDGIPANDGSSTSPPWSSSSRSSPTG